MFCPKCGISNPETGQYCRSCGTDLGNVSAALTGKLPVSRQILDRKGKPVSLESSIVKMFTGAAFLVVSLILAFSRMGEGWWFWLLIPAFTSLGAGVAQYVQLRNVGKLGYRTPEDDRVEQIPSAPNNVLTPGQSDYVSPESRYKTGDLVPPSVTDPTTNNLKLDSEGETMTLPKL